MTGFGTVVSCIKRWYNGSAAFVHAHVFLQVWTRQINLRPCECMCVCVCGCLSWCSKSKDPPLSTSELKRRWFKCRLTARWQRWRQFQLKQNWTNLDQELMTKAYKSVWWRDFNGDFWKLTGVYLILCVTPALSHQVCPVWRSSCRAYIALQIHYKVWILTNLILVVQANTC